MPNLGIKSRGGRRKLNTTLLTQIYPKHFQDVDLQYKYNIKAWYTRLIENSITLECYVVER